MNVDTKLPQFKSFLAENQLNNGGVKTTIDQSAVTAGENANVDLNLNGEDGNGYDKKSKKKKKDKDNSAEKKPAEVIKLKSDEEVKSMNMKLLNML